MEQDGRPPSYRLLHSLGECHREFLRLRHEVTGRGRVLALPVPPLAKIGGLDDLARLLFAASEGEGTDLPEACVEPESRQPADEPNALDFTPGIETPCVNSCVTPAAPCSIDSRSDFESLPSESPEPFDPLTPDPSMTPYIDGCVPAMNLPAEDIATRRHAESFATATETQITGKPGREPVPQPEYPPQDPPEVIRRTALDVLDRVLMLKVRDGGEYLPLEKCLSAALMLREIIAGCPPHELPAEAFGLAAGTHAFAGLLSLVESVQSLSDTQWASGHARVSNMFGRPLAVAAARGRFHTPSPD